MLQKLKLSDISTISKSVWFLEIYYILGYSINAWAHYNANKFYTEVWGSQSKNITPIELILSILITIMISLLVLSLIPKCQRRNSKVYILLVPIFVLLISIFSLSIITNGANLGLIGLMSALSFFILIVLFILFYDETPTNAKALELMHHRYLQFLSSFVWLVIIGGTWIVAFYLQQFPPKKFDIFPIAFIIAAIQNIFVGGVGLLLVAYSFNERLRDIERKLDDLQKENTPKKS